MRRWLRRPPPPAEAPLARPVWATPHGALPAVAGWRAAADALPDGAPLGDTLEQAFRDEMRQRAAAVVADWTLPRLTGLRVRRDALPDFWSEGSNLLLLAPGVAVPQLVVPPEGPPTRGLAAIAERASAHQLILGGTASLVALGDHAHMPLVSIQVADATMLVGADCGATVFSQFDARNGGAILIGDDTIIGFGSRVITDDMHAIRDRATGRRVNHRGGRVVIGRHVWIGEQVLIGGETVIGDGGVLGSQSATKGRVLPEHSVCTGRPARVTRTAIVWTREDAP